MAEDQRVIVINKVPVEAEEPLPIKADQPVPITGTVDAHITDNLRYRYEATPFVGENPDQRNRLGTIAEQFANAINANLSDGAEFVSMALNGSEGVFVIRRRI